MIVDPPRRGLDDALLAALRAPPPASDRGELQPDAFLREARALLGGGRLRLEAVVPYALFPHTAHVETLACFVRP